MLEFPTLGNWLGEEVFRRWWAEIPTPKIPGNQHLRVFEQEFPDAKKSPKNPRR